jgi:hypothetical protein
LLILCLEHILSSSFRLQKLRGGFLIFFFFFFFVVVVVARACNHNIKEPLRTLLLLPPVLLLAFHYAPLLCALRDEIRNCALPPVVIKPSLSSITLMQKSNCPRQCILSSAADRSLCQQVLHACTAYRPIFQFRFELHHVIQIVSGNRSEGAPIRISRARVNIASINISQARRRQRGIRIVEAVNIIFK